MCPKRTALTQRKLKRLLTQQAKTLDWILQAVWFQVYTIYIPIYICIYIKYAFYLYYTFTYFDLTFTGKMSASVSFKKTLMHFHYTAT